MSPCARWCGRALSSSWKLPPRGARRARPGGRGAEGTHTPPCPGGGLRAPALLPAGRGGKAREGEGRERGAETGGGARLPAPPPTSRTTGSRCCPLLPTAPRTPRPSPAPRGASGAPPPPGPWEPVPRLTRTDRFPVRKLPVTLEKPVGPTGSPPELATFHYSLVTSLLL